MIIFVIHCFAMQEIGNCQEYPSMDGPQSVPVRGSVGELENRDTRSMSHLASQATPWVPPSQAAMAAATAKVGEPAAFFHDTADLIKAFVVELLLVVLCLIWPGSSAARQALSSMGTVAEVSTDRQVPSTDLSALPSERRGSAHRRLAILCTQHGWREEVR